MGKNSVAREMKERLRRNGYTLVRQRGSHFIFKGLDGNTISINKDLNRMVAQRLVKENGLA